MKREERVAAKKRIIVLLIAFTMIFSEFMPFFNSFKAFADDGNNLAEYVKEELPKEVEAEISVEPTADTGKPFKMNVRLKMPRILTYKYQENFPASKMYDEYKNVKVVIPLPQGVKTVDPSYMQDGNIVIEFPKATDYDFEGETDKSIDIMLMTTDNGSVANGTKFVFSGAKWMCELDVYNEYNGTTGGQTTATDAEGAINEVTHTATAGDTWGLMKTHVKTVETDEHVVFYFNVDVGLEGTDDSGNKMLYSTATEEYNRYGRLNFDNYNVIDQIPELIQVNQDGSSQKTGIYPEEVKITKEAVSGYGIDRQVVYDSQNNQYEQGTTKSVEFDEYNEYDPNSQTDIIGISPQFTRYEVQLAYDKDAFLIASNEKIISTFKIENTAQVDYKLLGEAATSDYDSAQASYVIRRGTGQIVLSKYLVYPKDGETVREAYDAELSKTYPIEGQLKFKLYKDKDCTEPAVCIDGTAAEAVYDVNRGNAVFDYMESGTYYIKEIGGVKGFEPSEEPVAVTIPRSGGVGRITFDNENDTFGAAMFYKVKNVNEQQQPFEGVSFRIFKTKTEAEQNQASSAFMTVTTDRNGTAYVNDIPNGTYYVREVTPLNYDINEEIYTLNINNNIVVGLTDESGKVCGTEENPIVNESNVGTLYLGVIKWDVELKDEKEINYIMPSNQITPVASAYSGYKMDVYYENEDGEIVPYMENGRQLTLTTDKNGIVKKELPEGHYYVVASGYDSDKYTPWAQNNQTSGSTYFMGDFYVAKGDDNYNLPQPDKDGNINWNAGGAVDYKKEYNVIHNFSGVANMSLKKLGSSSYVVPEARFDVYKLDKKGGALTNKIYSNVQTNNKAYRFFSDVEPGWYAFVETATGPRYYLPEDINERRQDIEIVAPQFDQSLKGAASIEKHKAEMILRSKLVFFNNTLIDYTPLVGCTFEKVDAVTKEKLELGAKFIVYYYENNDPSGNRVYLSGFYYNTNTRKNVNYDQSQYETVFPNGFPLSKTYLTQGTSGTEFVPSFEDDTTTMVGWIPRSLVGKDIDLYVEEIVPPIGYKLPDDRADRIKKVTVKGGYVDEDNIITIENQPKEPSVSITVAVSNRNQSQSSDLISSSDRGTYVEGSTVRLYEWNEDDKKWEFVAEKNTKIDGTYLSESGAVFQTEYGKTYAIAEKKENNKGGLLFYDVAHKWIRSQSNDQLKSGNGFDYGTYKLEEQLTTDGWTLYGPITMPDSTTKAENYKFTFYNIPLQQMWLKKTDKYGDVIRGNGTFKIYMVPDGASPYDDVSKLKYITSYRSNRGWETYKGARLKPGQYVILEERAPSGYSKVPGQDRKVFYISGSISYIPGNTNVIGQLVTMYNIEKDYYLGFANNNMNKTVLSPTGTVKNSLLGHVGESIPVKYSISNLALSAPSQGGLVYENAVLEDSGLSYYAGINGNGDEIQLEKDDYAFTSIDVAKAVGRQGGFVKAQVQYKSAEDGSWKSAGTYTFSAQNTRVNLGSDNDKATAFRLIYDDASVKNGFTGGNITVNAVLYKRDIFKYDKEIISVKNTSSYEFDYSIYNETGSLEKHH